MKTTKTKILENLTTLLLAMEPKVAQAARTVSYRFSWLRGEVMDAAIASSIKDRMN